MVLGHDRNAFIPCVANRGLSASSRALRRRAPSDRPCSRSGWWVTGAVHQVRAGRRLRRHYRSPPDGPARGCVARRTSHKAGDTAPASNARVIDHACRHPIEVLREGHRRPDRAQPGRSALAGRSGRAALEEALRERGLELPAGRTTAAATRPTCCDARCRRAVRAGCRRVIAPRRRHRIDDGRKSHAQRNRRSPDAGDHPDGTAMSSPRARRAVHPRGCRGARVDGIALEPRCHRPAPDRAVFTQVGHRRRCADDPAYLTRESGASWAGSRTQSRFLRRAIRRRPENYDLEIDGKPLRLRAWQL